MCGAIVVGHGEAEGTSESSLADADAVGALAVVGAVVGAAERRSPQRCQAGERQSQPSQAATAQPHDENRGRPAFLKELSPRSGKEGGLRRGALCRVSQWEIAGQELPDTRYISGGIFVFNMTKTPLRSSTHNAGTTA